MKSQIFLLEGYGAPERPSDTLFSNEILSKIGQLNILSGNIEPQALQDYFKNITLTPDAEGYINIVLHAHGIVENGMHHITTHKGPKEHVDTQSKEWIKSLIDAVQGNKVKLLVTSCYGENMQEYLDLLPKGSMMMTISGLDSNTHGCDFLHPDIKKLFDSLPQDALNFDNLLQTYCLFQQDTHYEPIIGVHSLNGTTSKLRLNGEMADSYVLEAKEFSSFLQTAFKTNIITPENIIETLGSIYDSNQPENMGNLIITYKNLIDGVKNVLNDVINEKIPNDCVNKKFDELEQNLFQKVQDLYIVGKNFLSQQEVKGIFSQTLWLSMIKSQIDMFNHDLHNELRVKKAFESSKLDVSSIDLNIANIKKRAEMWFSDKIKNESPHFETDFLKYLINLQKSSYDMNFTPCNDFISKHSVALVCAAEAALKQSKKLAQMDHIENGPLTLDEILDQALAEFDNLKDNHIYNQVQKARQHKSESMKEQSCEFDSMLGQNPSIDTCLEQFFSEHAQQHSKLTGAAADLDS